MRGGDARIRTLDGVLSLNDGSLPNYDIKNWPPCHLVLPNDSKTKPSVAFWLAAQLIRQNQAAVVDFEHQQNFFIDQTQRLASASETRSAYTVSASLKTVSGDDFNRQNGANSRQFFKNLLLYSKYLTCWRRWEDSNSRLCFVIKWRGTVQL